MTNAKLQPVSSGGTDPDSILAKVEKFITDNDLFELHPDIADDVELEKPRLRDEKLLGKLTLFEQKCFIYGTLLESYLRDAVVTIEADANEKITAIMRERKILLAEAMHVYMTERNVQNPQIELNMAASTLTFMLSTYEWMVRSRTNCYQGRLIVREGFTVYTY